MALGVPYINGNILSVGRLTEKGYNVKFVKITCSYICLTTRIYIEKIYHLHLALDKVRDCLFVKI